MKKWVFLTTLLLTCLLGYAWADDFLGAPLPPDGETIISREDRIEKRYSVPYHELIKFYKDALKDFKYVKAWDRGDSVYMEDHLNRPWHSITIIQDGENVTRVLIIKDNWTWIIGTLVIRFIGVFVVLFVLYAALSLAGAVISRLVDRPKKKKASAAT